MKRLPFATTVEADLASADYLHTLVETNNVTETSWLLVFESAEAKSMYWHAVSGSLDTCEPFL